MQIILRVNWAKCEKYCYTKNGNFTILNGTFSHTNMLLLFKALYFTQSDDFIAMYDSVTRRVP